MGDDILQQMTKYDSKLPIEVSVIFDDSDDEIKPENVSESVSEKTNDRKRRKIEDEPSTNIDNISSNSDDKRNNNDHTNDRNMLTNQVSTPVTSEIPILKEKETENEHREGKTNTPNDANFYLVDLLKSVSEHLVILLQTYYSRPLNINNEKDFKEECAQRAKFTETYYNLSYCTVKSLILPHENNNKFITNFLNYTHNLAKEKKIATTQSKLHLTLMLKKLLQWTREKEKRLAAQTSQKKSAPETSDKDKLLRLQLNQQNAPLKINSNNSVQCTRNSDDTVSNSDINQPKTYHFGNPGSEIFINYVPTAATPPKQNNDNYNNINSAASESHKKTKPKHTKGIQHHTTLPTNIQTEVTPQPVAVGETNKQIYDRQNITGRPASYAPYNLPPDIQNKRTQNNTRVNQIERFQKDDASFRIQQILQGFAASDLNKQISNQPKGPVIPPWCLNNKYMGVGAPTPANNLYHRNTVPPPDMQRNTIPHYPAAYNTSSIPSKPNINQVPAYSSAINVHNQRNVIIYAPPGYDYHHVARCANNNTSNLPPNNNSSLGYFASNTELQQCFPQNFHSETLNAPYPSHLLSTPSINNASQMQPNIPANHQFNPAQAQPIQASSNYSLLCSPAATDQNLTERRQSINKELDITHDSMERIRSTSTDSGIMSPGNFSSASAETTNNSNIINGNEDETVPMITHVTSLNPKATYNNTGSCKVCGKVTKSVCLGCHGPYYCSFECQKMDWPLHLKTCKKKII